MKTVLGDTLLDLRFVARTLRKAPAFTLTAVATLALGIAAITAIFSTVNAALLKPLPYPHAEDLRSLRTAFTDGRLTTGLVAPAELARLADPSLSIVRAAATQRFDMALIRPDGTPVQPLVYGVSDGFFELFGLPMTIGRGFVREEHSPTGPLVVVLSFRAWRVMFGSDPDIVGTRLRFADSSATVAGVAARDFDIPHGTDLWANLRMNPQNIGHQLEGYVRVRPGTTSQRLGSELSGIMAGLARDYPTVDTGRTFTLRPLVDAIVGDLKPTLIVVMCATALLLMLACVNVANLLLARGSARVREIAVRTALGASRTRIVRQLLTESLVLSAAGSLAGLVLAYWGIRVLLIAGASKLSRLETIGFDGRVLLFALGALVASGVVVGLVPALRLASIDIKVLINKSGRSTTIGRGTHRLLGAMIVAEIALAITLVAGAGLLVRSFANLRSTNPGFSARGRVVFELMLPFTRYRDPAQVTAWSHDLLRRLRGISGVMRAAASSSFPLRPDRDGVLFVEIQGEPNDPNRPRSSRIRTVSAEFFDTMGIKLVSGRQFTDDDRPSTAQVAIVNRTFARLYLPGRDVTKVQFTWGFPAPDPQNRRVIVGLVDDVKYQSLGVEPEPAFYLVQDQFPMIRQTIVMAAALDDTTALIPAIRSEVRAMDPLLPLEVESVPALVASTLGRQQLGMGLMLLFSAIALILAAIGIYGVIAYASAQRRGEVATRMALGASPSDIFWLMVGQGLRLAVAGALLGVAAARATGTLASSLLYEVQVADPLILISALVAVIGIAVVATVIPARRAALIEPVIALRSE